MEKTFVYKPINIILRGTTSRPISPIRAGKLYKLSGPRVIDNIFTGIFPFFFIDAEPVDKHLSVKVSMISQCNLNDKKDILSTVSSLLNEQLLLNERRLEKRKCKM